MENTQNDHGLKKKQPTNKTKHPNPCIHGIMMKFLHSTIPTRIKTLKHKKYPYYAAWNEPFIFLWNVLNSW